MATMVNLGGAGSTLPSKPGQPSFPSIESCSTELSRLYTFIPRAVRSRIPVLTSLRRNIRTATSKKPTTSSTDSADNRVVKRDQVWSLTSSAVSSRPNISESLASSGSSSRTESPQRTADISPCGRAVGHGHKGGIDWQSATTGIMLWAQAERQLLQEGDANTIMLRKKCIDGVAYMLNSLPNDLSTFEIDGIRNALPASLRQKLELDRRRALELPESESQRRPNILSRSISFTIIQVAVFLSLILPSLLSFVRASFQYERKHQITERLLVTGVKAAETAGERGLDVKDAVVEFGQGRVGGVLINAGIWVVDGIFHGVSEGTGRGAVVVGQAMTSNRALKRSE